MRLDVRNSDGMRLDVPGGATQGSGPGCTGWLLGLVRLPAAWVLSQHGRLGPPRLGDTDWTEMTRYLSHALAIPFIISVIFGQVNQRSETFKQVGYYHLTTATGASS